MRVDSYVGEVLRQEGWTVSNSLRSFQLKAFLDVINDTLVTKPYLSVGNFIILGS